ncbi:MAG: DUF4956 domain-containing protein [Phycisphaerae bacterium]|jgi:hypothetical protein|nr:DUF4956 domain-containing protein [Phycisphaerae bacterium]
MNANEWIDLVFRSDVGMAASSPEGILLILLLSFTIGQVVGWIYMWSHDSLSYSKTFVASLAVIPVIVAMMMQLMSSSIVVAFGLLAVFAVVRFRNVLKDTRDTTFILWVIVEGMAVGTLRYSTAVIGLLFVAVVLLYLRVTAFGSRRRFDATLSLRLTGDLAEGWPQLREVLRRHALRSQLASERPLANEGVDLSYHVQLRNPARGDEMQSDVQRLAGVEHVSFYLRSDDGEI